MVCLFQRKKSWVWNWAFFHRIKDAPGAPQVLVRCTDILHPNKNWDSSPTVLKSSQFIPPKSHNYGITCWDLLNWIGQKLPQVLGDSVNGGTPKSSILIGFSIINHPFCGTPIFGNTHLSPSRKVRTLFWPPVPHQHHGGEVKCLSSHGAEPALPPGVSGKRLSPRTTRLDVLVEVRINWLVNGL